MKPTYYLVGSLVLISLLTGCATTGQGATRAVEGSSLTHGQVQMTLHKGVTTKTEVLEVFGAPNITTVDASGREVWTYQRHARVASSESSESFGTIILMGGSSRASGFEESSRTMTLIIKFDDQDRVYDFRSRYASF